MYRLLSVVKNTVLLLALVSNRGANAKAPDATPSSSSSSSTAAAAKPTGWVSASCAKPKDMIGASDNNAYMAASTPKKLVSVSRRSITFYDEDHKNLDYGHLIGASFVKTKPKKDIDKTKPARDGDCRFGGPTIYNVTGTQYKTTLTTAAPLE
jgi:hypothetical protein